MRTIFFISLLLVFNSCKKYPEDIIIPVNPPNPNNQVKAVIILSTGDTVKINAAGSKAFADYGGSGYGFYINGDGTVSSDPAIQINAVLIQPASPGKYKLSCIYWPNGRGIAFGYQNNSSDPADSIMFSILNNQYAEGYFNTVCRLHADSVIISGTFKGYLQ